VKRYRSLNSRKIYILYHKGQAAFSESLILKNCFLQQSILTKSTIQMVTLGYTINTKLLKTREKVIQIMHTSFQHYFPIPVGASEAYAVHIESYGQ